MAQGGQLVVRDNTDLSKGSTNQGQPGYPVPPDQSMSPAQLRDLFLQTALYRSILTDPVAYNGVGSTATTKIPQTGLAQQIRLLANLTATTTAGPLLAANVLAKSPYSHITSLIYNDPSGNVRINSNPWNLYLLMASKTQWGYDPSNGNVGTWTTDAAVGPLIFNNPIPVNAGVNVRFFVDLPLTMSDFDTRGGMLLESATSPSFLSITFNPLPMDLNASASIESPYSNIAANAASLAITGTIQPVYYFFQPTYVRGPQGAVLPIPVDDLNMVHEVLTQRNSSAITTNNDTRYTFPTGRSYYRIIASYTNNNAQSLGVSAVKFAYDNANFTLNENLQAYLCRVRRAIDRDLPKGVYLWDSSRRPWDSNHYGQLDAILTTDATALVNPYIDYTRDSLYMAPIG